jgi:hypothetical protein
VVTAPLPKNRTRAPREESLPLLGDPVVLRAVECRAKGWTHARIAKEIGKNVDTVAAWLARPDVLAYQAELEQRVAADIVGVRSRCHREALDALLDVARDPSVTGELRIRAATTVLDRTEPDPPEPARGARPAAPELVREPAAVLGG